MKYKEQYGWNIVFSFFFVGLIGVAVLFLHAHHISYRGLSFFEYALVVFASFRFTRLIVYDKITAFFREQFCDEVDEGGEIVFIKPARGPRRTMADLLSCPWCFGMWSTASVLFFYLAFPSLYFPILILALSGVATMIQLFSNMIGWKAESLKQEVNR